MILEMEVKDYPHLLKAILATKKIEGEVFIESKMIGSKINLKIEASAECLMFIELLHKLLKDQQILADAKYLN